MSNENVFKVFYEIRKSQNYIDVKMRQRSVQTVVFPPKFHPNEVRKHQKKTSFLKRNHFSHKKVSKNEVTEEKNKMLATILFYSFEK